MALTGAESSSTAASRSLMTLSDEFLASLSGSRRVVFVSHRHPDPDSLGSMMGLASLVEAKLRIPTVITQDGPICRAENRAMVECLGIKLIPVESLRLESDDGIVVVDSQPGTGRHSLNFSQGIRAVIDHHITPGDLRNVAFSDIRPHFGATCTIVTNYLLEQKVPISQVVATALLYGIETEVSGFPREAGPDDDHAMSAIFPLAERDWLAQVRNARLSQSHFTALAQAIHNSIIMDRLLFAWVEEIHQPDQAAEIVDFLIRYDEVDWALCAGVYKNQLILSMRAAKANADAGTILRGVVGSYGSAGGHERRAGGMIPLDGLSPADINNLRNDLLRRLAQALRLPGTRSQKSLLPPAPSWSDPLQATPVLMGSRASRKNGQV